jgi:hypothetical protein
MVEETARLCALKAPAAASRFWRMQIRRLTGELQVAGVSEDVIEEQLRQFADTVLGMLRETQMGFPDEAA